MVVDQKIKVDFKELDDSPILDFYKKWKKIIKDKQDVEYDLEKILKHIGFTDIVSAGGRIDGTFGGIRYIGLSLINQKLGEAFIKDENPDIPLTLYYKYSIKEIT